MTCVNFVSESRFKLCPCQFNRAATMANCSFIAPKWCFVWCMSKINSPTSFDECCLDWMIASTPLKFVALLNWSTVAQLVLASIPAGLTGRVSIWLYFCLTILSFAVVYPPFQRHALCDLDQSARLRWLFLQQTRPVTGGEACHDNYSCYACVRLFASDPTGPCHCL